MRRSETFDENSRPYFRFFLEEFTPKGRLAELNEKGHCVRAWDEPVIAEAEAAQEGLLEAEVGATGLVVVCD